MSKQQFRNQIFHCVVFVPLHWRQSMLLTALESERGGQTWSCGTLQVLRAPALYPRCFRPQTYTINTFHQLLQNRKHLHIPDMCHKATLSVRDSLEGLQTYVTMNLCSMEFLLYCLTHDLLALLLMRLSVLQIDSLTTRWILNLGFKNISKWYLTNNRHKTNACWLKRKMRGYCLAISLLPHLAYHLLNRDDMVSVITFPFWKKM